MENLHDFTQGFLSRYLLFFIGVFPTKFRGVYDSKALLSAHQYYYFRFTLCPFFTQTLESLTTTNDAQVSSFVHKTKWRLSKLVFSGVLNWNTRANTMTVTGRLLLIHIQQNLLRTSLLTDAGHSAKVTTYWG